MFTQRFKGLIYCASYCLADWMLGAWCLFVASWPVRWPEWRYQCSEVQCGANSAGNIRRNLSTTHRRQQTTYTQPNYVLKGANANDVTIENSLRRSKRQLLRLPTMVMAVRQSVTGEPLASPPGVWADTLGNRGTSHLRRVVTTPLSLVNTTETEGDNVHTPTRGPHHATDKRKGKQSHYKFHNTKREKEVRHWRRSV